MTLTLPWYLLGPKLTASDCLRLPQLVSDCLDHQDLGFVKTSISFWRYSMFTYMFTYFTFKLAGLKMHWICTPWMLLLVLVIVGRDMWRKVAERTQPSADCCKNYQKLLKQFQNKDEQIKKWNKLKNVNCVHERQSVLTFWHWEPAQPDGVYAWGAPVQGSFGGASLSRLAASRLIRLHRPDRSDRPDMTSASSSM